jgi:hypothetical protein
MPIIWDECQTNSEEAISKREFKKKVADLWEELILNFLTYLQQLFHQQPTSPQKTPRIQAIPEYQPNEAHVIGVSYCIIDQNHSSSSF